MENNNHDLIMKEVAELFSPVLLQSPQGVYLYLDEENRVCNQNFAEFLGYDSVQAWRFNTTPETDVSVEDRENEEKAYYEAAELMKAVSLNVTYQRQDKIKIKASVIMIPFEYKDKLLVLHFVSSLDKQ